VVYRLLSVMHFPMIPYGRQHITQADIDAVVEVLKSDFLTQGPRIRAFEEKFAHYTGSKYAVAVSSGTAALHLCALALEVDERSYAITSPLTFAASANCILYAGGTIEFADIDPETLLMNIDIAREMIEDAPSNFYQGMIVVDFAGYPTRMDQFRNLADEHGMWIIEDSCHAPGGFFTDENGIRQHCGNGQYADLAIFSFHPVKHIAAGEGGMITTNRGDLYQKLLRLRTHGITKDPELLEENHGGWYYEMHELGYNYRITDIQCALGISQLDRAAENLQRRRAIAQKYDEAFWDTSIHTIQPPEDGGHAHHLYIIQVKDRKGLYDYLRKHDIYAQVHYIPVPWLPYYQQMGYKKEDYPQAGKYYDHCLSIPLYPTLTDEQQDFVIEKVKKYCLG